MLHISDHALVRYVDRRLRIGVDKLGDTLGIHSDRDILTYFARECRVNVEAWSRELSELVAVIDSPPDEKGYVWADGFGYLVRNNTLVTIIPEKPAHRPKKRTRQPKLRRPGVLARQFSRPGRIARRKALENRP